MNAATASFATAPQQVTAAPKEIRLRRARRTLELTWPDGLHSEVSCLALRKACACSNCQLAQQRGALTLIDAEVGIDRLELSGVSGLQLYFSDGHFRGLYPWGYLRDISERLA
ncbi:DUF971 domain-containing protein [Stutzerimonas azotifigens]|uniref:DUF971 domain-containing protein n=1 Tax=Stutzerimonas azotifigens TaxID=291995 RepID=UPI0003FA686F|nr:DUF971 domain-containing protein [Stutzerimonas azotifigens]